VNSPVAWALAAHVVGIVFWMGGLLVATQVLASHTQETSSEARRALARLEQKLLRGIAHPGAAITVLAGIVVVAIQPDYLRQSWLQAKLSLVVILIAIDLVVTARIRAYQAGRIEVYARQAKLVHGLIAALFLGIVILVMIKPGM
jgi:protoporphyrinogen IX oxidase